MGDEELELNPSNKAERKALWLVLAINMFQVVMAGTVGFLAESSGLVGAALDNLSDSAVYIVSIYAIGKGVVAKARAATLSGILLIIMGLLLLFEVVRRFFTETDPIGWAMIITAIVNAASNVIAMRLLKPQQEKGVHIEASMEFTSNDMLVNLGIVLSGVAVMLLGSPIPDLLTGFILAGIVLTGGVKILRKAKKARKMGEIEKEEEHTGK
ncbi:cation efflux family protein [Pontibacter ummariensis]|uniref:Cation efflux family protein n=1 Tax=Pontibacter ummariensis TaxID=1610492 RepID=A0A239JAF7_9BACT|nr:cation transporter [Pontibacter ummariensis]PRY08332.1 cation efflux family protein [Pontibacter ummariensis]SNT02840.1 Cation efflux family protein [Pontibacter ummariensis]